MNSQNNHGENMQPMFERRPISIWNALGFAAVALGTAFGWGVVYTTMNTNNATAAQSVTVLKDDIKEIKGQLPTISQLQYQMTTVTQQANDNKQNVESFNRATNDRIDRVVQSFGDKLDTITDRLNKIATGVEVLSTRMGDTKPQRKE